MIKFSEGEYGAIEEGIKGVEVGILINNVGITYPRAMFFHEVDQLTWTKILRVNLEATTWVTRSLIRPMLHRRRGAIVNISSGAAVVVPSHPLYAIYAATKAYQTASHSNHKHHISPWVQPKANITPEVAPACKLYCLKCHEASMTKLKGQVTRTYNFTESSKSVINWPT
ncbi:hypothetical protein N665_1657s0002 [Sinapis alba]|nr:hypothetical protein N665_1657s0002 [Sinapis alba]